MLGLHGLQFTRVQAEQPQDGRGDLGGIDRSADGAAILALTLALALALTLALALALGAAASAAIGGARTIAGHAPGPFGRKEPSGGGQA